MKSIILAQDHRGLRCNGSRILRENHRGYSGMRKGMADHLAEVAQRYYSGDVSAVDEFLQLYCFGEEQRKALQLNGGVK